MTRAPSASSCTIASEVSLIALALAGCGGLGLYAAAVEPRLLRLRQPVVRWPGWPAGRPPLRIGVLADLHAARPHMSEARIARIAARLLAAGPDLVLLPGDFVSTHTPFVRRIAIERVAEALARTRRRRADRGGAGQSRLVCRRGQDSPGPGTVTAFASCATKRSGSI